MTELEKTQRGTQICFRLELNKAVKFIECPAIARISHVKKFIEVKFQADTDTVSNKPIIINTNIDVRSMLLKPVTYKKI